MTGSMVERIIAAKHHPEQGVRAGLGILSLLKRFGQERVENACARGLIAS